jgi:hypothetical protein
MSAADAVATADEGLRFHQAIGIRWIRRQF